MANKIGYFSVTAGLLTDVDTAARQVVGTKTFDEAGNEYIYLIGIGSTVIGSAVSFGLAAVPFQSALTVTTVRGQIGFAMAATLATQFGWYQIGGYASALFNASAVTGTLLFSASTGKVDDAVVTGDRIEHAIVAATVASGVLGSIYIDHPFMCGNG